MPNARYRITATVKALLIAAIGLLGFAVHAQTDVQHKNWLECDVDWIYNTYASGPNFTVKVLFHDAPVSSVKVVLARQGSRPDEIVATSRTNTRGIARFSGISSGKYRISPDQELLSPIGEEIEIDAKSNAKTEIKFQWPVKSVVARDLRGVLLASDESEEAALPLPYVSVQLFDLRRGSLIARTNTDGEGHFEFPSFGDDLYVVRLNEDEYADSEHQDMAVEIKSNAAGEEIPTMKIVRSGCTPGLFRLDGLEQ
jgi:hypothetical protein